MQKKQGDDRRYTRRPVVAVFMAMLAGAACGGGEPAPLHFLVTNDDMLRAAPPSTVSFYALAADGSLTNPVSVSTGGNGMAGGYLGIARLVVTESDEKACVYASNAQSENIAGFDAGERSLTGLFHGTVQDVKIARDGIGLAPGEKQLFATFSGSGNIAAFHMQAGCKLEFIGEVHAQGLSGGKAEGMAAHGNTLVVSYGDGSVGSFDVSKGVPVAHDDAQYLPGVREDFIPGAVDIARDGHYAVFGGGSTRSEVQVSDISAGKIGPPHVYTLGSAWSSDSVRLSPDESLLYVSNSSGGRVTAAFFDRKTGEVRQGCTSDPLRGFYSRFTYIGAIATELPSGTGGILYVPEYDAGGRSSIGMLSFAATSTGCTLTEMEQSPVAGPAGPALLSIGVYPPRPF